MTRLHHKGYGTTIKLCLIAALLLLNLAVKLDLTNSDPAPIAFVTQDIIEFEDIPVTEQERKLPPPPPPRIVVEVPNDEIIAEDELIFDDPFEVGDPLDLPPPPPPVEEEPELEPEPDFFVVVEKMPELIGSLADVHKQIKYPDIARKAGVEGRVIIQFIVGLDGSVEEATIVRGIGAGCDEEALRVVRGIKFTPGLQRGKEVRVKMSLPIAFRLR